MVRTESPITCSPPDRRSPSITTFFKGYEPLKGHGKPAPDVYLEAARLLGTELGNTAAVEDSGNGILSAKAAGMRVVAIPNLRYPPDEEALGTADVVLRSIDELTPAAIELLPDQRRPRLEGAHTQM